MSDHPAITIRHNTAAISERIYVPQKSKKTEILTGSARESVAKLIEKLKHEARVI